MPARRSSTEWLGACFDQSASGTKQECAPSTCQTRRNRMRLAPPARQTASSEPRRPRLASTSSAFLMTPMPTENPRSNTLALMSMTPSLSNFRSALSRLLYIITCMGLYRKGDPVCLYTILAIHWCVGYIACKPGHGPLGVLELDAAAAGAGVGVWPRSFS